MNREALKIMGLTDEQIESVMKSHGDVVNKTKQDLSDVTAERDTLQTTLKDRDEQLDKLKDVDPEKLQKEIADLQQANENKEKEHAATVKDLQLTNAIKLAVTGKVVDEEVAAGLINKENLVIGDDGKIVGLDEQLTSLQESKAYLFKPEEPQEGNGAGAGAGTPPPGFRVGGDGKGSNEPQPISLADAISQQINK